METSQNLSAIEQIPHELVWMILDFVPEVALNLRRVSRMMKSCFDKYAMHRKCVPFVEALNINKVPSISISLRLKGIKFQWFKCRLIQHPSFTAEIRNIYKRKDCETVNIVWRESMYGAFLVHLEQCIGAIVKRVSLGNLNDPDARKVVSKLIEGKQFGEVHVHGMIKVTKETGDFLKSISTHEMELFSLYVGEIEEDPVEFLTHFATFSRSMMLIQSYTDGIRKSSRYLYGINNAEFASIIVGLLSKKTDTLTIDTVKEEFLSKYDVQVLIEKLPLLGKKLWFTANCTKLVGNTALVNKDHIIRVDMHENYHVMSVKHF